MPHPASAPLQPAGLGCVHAWPADRADPTPTHACSKALLQRRGVLVNMTADEATLSLATGG